MFRWLLLIPAFFTGTLCGMLFLGIAPTLALDAFWHDFHYTAAARRWVEISGMIGGAAAIIAVTVGLWTTRYKKFSTYLQDHPADF